MDAKKVAGASASTSVADKDNELIKKTFKDQEALLKTVRSLMYGIELLPDEKTNVKGVFSDAALLDMMQRRFLPDIKQSRDLPLGQIQDTWLGAEQMIFGASAMQIEQAMRYKESAIDMTKHALELLRNPDAIAVDYKISSYQDDLLQINLMARNMFLRHVDQQLLMLHVIADQKEETAKEAETRNLRNSMK